MCSLSFGLISTICIGIVSHLGSITEFEDFEFSLKGRTVILTGGNIGLGKEIAIAVADHDARLIIATKFVEKAQKTREQLFQATGNYNIRVMELDLEDFDSVRRFAKEVIHTEERIDFLLNNAAVLYSQGLTEEGYGKAFVYNYLGPFLLVNLLLKKFETATNPVRIINVAPSLSMFWDLDLQNLHIDPSSDMENLEAFVNSKLASIYFTKELANVVQSGNVAVFAVDSGIRGSSLSEIILPKIAADIALYFTRPFFGNPYHEVDTILYLMLDKDVIRDSGKYFMRKTVTEIPRFDNQLSKELWKKSLLLVGLS